jgi:hypothetical protein
MFAKIKQLNVSEGATRSYAFDAIEGRPSLRVASATQSNPGYLNAVLKDKRLGKRRKLDVAAMSENRNNDRDLYAKFVTKGWETPALRDDGTPATNEDIRSFLDALPDDLFDELRTFCGDPANFRESDGEISGN